MPSAELMVEDRSTAIEPIPVRVVSVESRAVARTVSVVGTLYGYEHITVTPKVEGKVVAIHCDVGDRVRPGALLLEIEATDYELAVREAERALEAELARLGLTQPPGPDFDIEQLPAVESARLVRENAARQYQREKELFARHAGVLQQFEQAETDLKVADASLRQARLNALAILAAVRHRQAVLDVARQRLADTRLYAPTWESTPNQHSSSGDFVVAKRLVSVGEMVRAFPSTPAFELVRDDILKLRVFVPERHVSEVRVGMEVLVRSEAYPHDVFPALVTRIYPTINPTNRSFEVEAEVPNTDHRLKDGGFVKADVVVSRTDRAIVIPVEAVVQLAGVLKVFVVNDNVARAVEITLGAQGPDWVEAIGDLRAGDQVVVSGQTRLVDGSPVRLLQQREDRVSRPGELSRQPVSIALR